MGASVDPTELHNNRSTFEFVSDLSDQIRFFPSSLKINRQWAGGDMTPIWPVAGTTPVKGFFLMLDGHLGFKATPVSENYG